MWTVSICCACRKFVLSVTFKGHMTRSQVYGDKNWTNRPFKVIWVILRLSSRSGIVATSELVCGETAFQQDASDIECSDVFYTWISFLCLLLDGTNDDDKNDSEDETQQKRSYSLRVHKPRTQLYIAPAIGKVSWLTPYVQNHGCFTFHALYVPGILCS